VGGRNETQTGTREVNIDTDRGVNHAPWLLGIIVNIVLHSHNCNVKEPEIVGTKGIKFLDFTKNLLVVNSKSKGP